MKNRYLAVLLVMVVALFSAQPKSIAFAHSEQGLAECDESAGAGIFVWHDETLTADERFEIENAVVEALAQWNLDDAVMHNDIYPEINPHLYESVIKRDTTGEINGMECGFIIDWSDNAIPVGKRAELEKGIIEVTQQSIAYDNDTNTENLSDIASTDADLHLAGRFLTTHVDCVQHHTTCVEDGQYACELEVFNVHECAMPGHSDSIMIYSDQITDVH